MMNTVNYAGGSGWTWVVGILVMIVIVGMIIKSVYQNRHRPRSK